MNNAGISRYPTNGHPDICRATCYNASRFGSHSSSPFPRRRPGSRSIWPVAGVFMVTFTILVNGEPREPTGMALEILRSRAEPMVPMRPDRVGRLLLKALSLLVLVGTVVGFVISFVMLERVIGASSPWLGLLAMFYVLGLARVSEPFVLLRMPEALREVRSWELKAPLYRRLLVPAFGTMLRDTPLRYLNPSVYLSRRQPDFASISRQAEAAEADHFWAGLLFTPYIMYLAFVGHAVVAALFLLVQVLFNVYPILHLRLVRGRIDRLARRRPMVQSSGIDSYPLPT